MPAGSPGPPPAPQPSGGLGADRPHHRPLHHLCPLDAGEWLPARQQTSGSRQVRGLGSGLDGAVVGVGAALCLPGLVAGPWGRSNSQHLMELQIPGRCKVQGAKREASTPGMQGHGIISAECRPRQPRAPLRLDCLGFGGKGRERGREPLERLWEKRQEKERDREDARETERDFPGGPVVKAASAGDLG